MRRPQESRGARVQGIGAEGGELGARVQGTGARVQGTGARVQGIGARVEGTGARMQGTGARGQGTGERVERHLNGDATRGAAFIALGAHMGMGSDWTVLGASQPASGTPLSALGPEPVLGRGSACVLAVSNSMIFPELKSCASS